MREFSHYHVDGRVVSRETASVSADDRGFCYGDGFTEWMRAYNGRVFERGAHERRIEAACEALSIPYPIDLENRIDATLAANGASDALVRLTVSRGDDPRSPPDLDAVPTVVIATGEASHGGRRSGRTARSDATNETDPGGGIEPEAGSDAGRTPITDSAFDADHDSDSSADGDPVPAVVGTVTIRRSADADPVCERVARLRAWLELARAATDRYRADEALVRDEAGFVTGGIECDLLFMNENALRVPANDPVGVLRPVLCDLAHDERIPVERDRYLPSAVREADEAFLVSAVEGLEPISRLDGIAVGDGPVRRLLSMALDELIETEYY